MDVLLIALRLLLAGVFAVAGVAKLRDLPGSRRALEDFGVTPRLASPGGVLLPVAEITIAVSLLFPPSATLGALAAAALLGVFVLAIANALAHGRSPDCHCFGQAHSEPAGWRTIARNGVLIGFAVVLAAAGPGPALDEWLADRSPIEIAALAATLATLALAGRQFHEWNQLRERRRLAAWYAAQAENFGRPAGHPEGTIAPAFRLRGVRGENVTLDELCARGLPVVLVFMHVGCAPCRQLLPQLAEWQQMLAGRLTIAALSEGNMGRNRMLSEEHGVADLLVQEHSEMYDAYEVRGTPSAVVVDPEGKIASATVVGPLVIEELVRVALSRTEAWKQPSPVA